MNRLEECYRLLDVEPSASADEIRGAYLALVNVWHPDRFTHDPGLQDRAMQKLKAINGAFEAIRQAPLRNGRGAASFLAARPAPEPAGPVSSEQGVASPRTAAEWVAFARQLGTAVELRSGEALTWNNVGNLNQRVEVIRAYQRAVTLQPDFADAWCALGIAHAQLHEYKDAVNALRQAVTLQPGHVAAWLQLGTVLAQLQRYPEVMEAFREALRVRPDDASAWYALGVAYAHDQIRRYEDARQAYLEAVRLKPDLAEGWFALGRTCLRLSDERGSRTDEALKALKEAVLLKPDLAEAWCTLGVTLNEAGRHDEAIQALRQALDLRPEDGEAWFNLGTAARLGRVADAGTVVEEALSNLKRIDRREAARFLETLPRHQRIWLNWRGDR